MNSRKQKSRATKASFLALPHAVMRHPDFAESSPRATKLLLDIAVEYNGKNNGDLNAALSRLQCRGWNSSSQLAKAKKELLERGLIVETRMGGLGIGPSLYAVTWLDLNESRKILDVNARTYRRRVFSLPSSNKDQASAGRGAIANSLSGTTS